MALLCHCLHDGFTPWYPIRLFSQHGLLPVELCLRAILHRVLLLQSLLSDYRGICLQALHPEELMGWQTVLHLYVRGCDNIHGVLIHGYFSGFACELEDAGDGQLIMWISLVFVRECDLLDTLSCCPPSSVYQLSRGDREDATNELCRDPGA